MMRFTALLLVTGLGIAGTFAGYQSGIKALNRHDYDKARLAFEEAAADGNADAMHQLGDLYRWGKGMAQDRKTAATWFLRAAEQGHVAAQRALAGLYSDGLDDVPDGPEAIDWYEAAARTGDSSAQHDLALIFLEGELVPKNLVAAVGWFRACAELDDPDCQSHLGSMYAEGRGVERDDAIAYSWLRKSADHGDEEGQYHLARLYLEGRGVARDASAAASLLERSVAQDHRPAKLEMARLLFEGRSFRRDRVRALTLAAPAAAVDDEKAGKLIDDHMDDLTPEQLLEAADEMEDLYASGDYSSAALIAELLAHRGNSTAQFYLGQMSALGFGTPQNLIQAYKWLTLGEESDRARSRSLKLRIKNGLTASEIEAIDQAVSRWRPVSWRISDAPSDSTPTAGKSDVTTPRRIHHRRPVYPETARLRRQQGRVIVIAIITEDGRVVEPFVVSCDTPRRGFEESALSAVSEWRYAPSTLNGAPVEVYFTIVVDYELHPGPGKRSKRKKKKT